MKTKTRLIFFSLICLLGVFASFKTADSYAVPDQKTESLMLQNPMARFGYGINALSVKQQGIVDECCTKSLNVPGTCTCSCCRGYGFLVDAACGGTGRVLNDNGVWVICPSCNGSGKLICGCCNGRGWVYCY